MSRDTQIELGYHKSTVLRPLLRGDAAIDAAIRNGADNTVLLWCPDEWIPAVY